MAIGQELLNVPMGDMIRQMAFAIAEAQIKLDESSIEVAEMMGGLRVVRDDQGEVAFDDSRVFFGYEYMTVDEAKAYIEADKAISGGEESLNVEALSKLTDKVGEDTRIRVPTRISMLELGFTPTFYQFVDTIIEVKIAIKITKTREYGSSRSNKTEDTIDSKSKSNTLRIRPFRATIGTGSSETQRKTVSTSQVDAHYSAKYSYSAEGSSLLRTKLAPVPPPPVLEERIRNLMEIEQQRREAQLPAKKPNGPGGGG